MIIICSIIVYNQITHPFSLATEKNIQITYLNITTCHTDSSIRHADDALTHPDL